MFFLQLNKNSDFVNRKSTTQKNIKYNFWVEMETLGSSSDSYENIGTSLPAVVDGAGMG